MEERSVELTVPLGYSDDFGPSKNYPDLEAVLDPFEGLRFRTRFLDIVTIEVKMQRFGIPIGMTAKEDRSHLLSAPVGSLTSEVGELIAPLLGIEIGSGENFVVPLRIERGRYLEIKDLNEEDMTVTLHFVDREK